jgi:hypothetical protein
VRVRDASHRETFAPAAFAGTALADAFSAVLAADWLGSPAAWARLTDRCGGAAMGEAHASVRAPAHGAALDYSGRWITRTRL